MDHTVSIIQNVLDKIGINGRILLEDRNGTRVYNIDTDDAQLLIGERGVNLSAFQHVIRLLARKTDAEQEFFLVDVGNYRKRREDFLRMLATRAVEEVRNRKCAIMLKPMSAYERRVIHLYLSGYEDVISESRGEGQERRVLVKPKQN